MLAQARARADAEGQGNISFQEGDAERIPFPDGSFTLVTARHAPHHFHDVPQFLSEARRVLTPEGRFVMSDGICPTEEGLDWLDRWQRLRDPSHFYSRTVAQWQDLAGEAGFKWVQHTLVPYRLEFDWWVRQSGSSETTIVELRSHAKAAAESLHQPMGLKFDTDGEVVAYVETMLVVRLDPV